MILSKTIFIDPNVNRDLSVYLRLDILRVSQQFSTQAT